MTKQKRKKRRLPGVWPASPPDKQVVLHTRVVTDTGGGPDKTILFSAPFMADTRYWVVAAYMHPPNDPGFEQIKKRASDAGCPLIGVPDRGPLDRSVVQVMLDLCRRYKVKIWHGHDYKSNAIGLMLRPFWPMKLVTTVHGWVKHTTRTPLYYMVDRWSLPYYHHVICVSDDLLERVRSLGVPPERCTFIPNAIDERAYRRRFPAAKSPLRGELKTPAGRLVIGAVGRLSPEKGFHDLIHATETLIKQGLDVEVWITGEGDARADLQKLIDHLRLGERVRLLGFNADMIGLYHAMDIYVLSSLREGLPNVLLEAMAMGVPVVSTRVAGVPALITDEQTGLLTPIGDPAKLAEAMRRLVTDEGLRERLAAAARKHIEREYSFARRMDCERAIYDSLLAEPVVGPKIKRSVVK